MTELSSHIPEGHSDSSHLSPTSTPRAPLAGIIVGVLFVAGFAGWAGVRIHAATTQKKALAEQRENDARRAANEARAVPKVRVIAPVATEWAPVVEVDGTLAAGRSAELGFETPGRLAQVTVRVGDMVKAGQVLASLDTGEISAQLKAAQAQARAAEAQLTLAADQERRTATMVQSGSLAEANGVQSTQQKALATAQLDAARAQVSLSQVALGNHRLVAPFAGSVTRAPEGVGGVVGPGSSLFEIVDLAKLKLRGTLGEHDAALVAPGSKISIESDHGTVEGTVTVVLGSVDAATRRVRMEAEIDNQEKRLRAGSFVRGTVRSGTTLPVLKLPHDVLRPGAQDELFVVANGTLQSRRVVYSVTPEGELLVRRGLGATEQVVRSPKSDTQAGERAEIDSTPATAAAPKASR
ncbi:MAG TPA: efflux RND transporter periplasmic adaptor subunit [Polyangiaceae bacterium]